MQHVCSLVLNFAVFNYRVVPAMAHQCQKVCVFIVVCPGYASIQVDHNIMVKVMVLIMVKVMVLIMVKLMVPIQLNITSLFLFQMTHASRRWAIPVEASHDERSLWKLHVMGDPCGSFT